MTPKRINLWERKLLDLTMGNTLINTRYGVSCLQLTDHGTESFYQSFLLSKQMPLVSVDDSGAGLHSVLDSDTMRKTAKNILSTAMGNLSEIGSEQLFLAIGMLHWVDNPDALHPNAERQQHIAPALLVPVHITRQRITGIYYIHPTSEEPMVNITLVEMLKQQHERDLSKLIPQNGDTPNFERVMADFSKMAQSKENDGWTFTDEVCLGLFSFAKFVMWNDIHSNTDKMRETSLVESLVQKRMLESETIPDSDARLLDSESRPIDMALPLLADSSQIEAVADVALGKSFLLYGPPGTGKSQTITNIIADTLYHGKQVLFVAQKRAALEVVQERLASIGLAPFCLELHSNKISKTHIINQLSTILEMQLGEPDDKTFCETSDRLFAQRQKLIAYTGAVHQQRKMQSGTYSLADCIEQCISINQKGDMLGLDQRTMLQTTNQELQELANILNEIDTIRPSYGDVNKHPLLGIYPKDGRRESLDTLQSLLKEMRKTLVEMSLNQSGIGKIFRLPRLKKQFHLQLIELDDIAVHSLNDTITYEEKQQTISRWLNNWTLSSAWGQWSTRYCQICAIGYPQVAASMTTEDGCLLANKVYYEVNRTRAMDIIENDETLVMFNSKIFDKVVTDYRTLASEYQTLTAQHLVLQLQNNVRTTLTSLNPLTQQSLTQIRRWIKNHGHSMSIRTLFSLHGATIRALCPCMLMSPISVAQYLPIENDPFHVVLFDEASQIPTSEAVGAIARGKATVIVGDPKQMPPTTFFQTQLNTEDDIENNDMESILDDCITLGMRGHYLNCHYRSRHESLIAFSNHYYYGDRLITFPSVDDRECRIHYNHVAGVYDYSRTRTNRIEAEAIVDEIVKRLQDTNLCQHSMGVIAFSKVQQVLIEDLLQERISRNHELERRAWGEDMTEPLFIKNLENVQGDERDVILFSVCYGWQEDGKISMNFGPLNNTGGERRLNVATTRARQEMVVFSNMHSDDIDLEKSNTLGVEGLKNFLYYAENGILPANQDEENKTQETTTNPIAIDIAQALRKEGYQCDLSVGRSKFRIDVAVLDKKHIGKYKLGILIDGRNYYDTPMVRDRELVQPVVLKGLGWQLIRIWQPDYFRNPNETIQSVLGVLRN